MTLHEHRNGEEPLPIPAENPQPKKIKALLRSARAAYEHDLQKLLATTQDRWVAYRGQKMVATAATQEELMSKIGRSYDPQELFIAPLQLGSNPPTEPPAPSPHTPL